MPTFAKQLSILIPSRNEMFLRRTVEDILQHIEADTEILVGLDGEWANPPLEDHDRVRILYYPESIGQRKMTNQLAKMSHAKYVMKVDAHCAFDQGFDRKMIEAFEELGDNVTMVPIMRNLHAFNLVCKNCQLTKYQGPTIIEGNRVKCTKCDGTEWERDVVWIPKESPQSTSYCFDPEPHFQYFNDYKKRQRGDLVETMSLQGSAFMLTRDKYWELNICDENFGSWGSQGIEVAAKTWLSGGRVIVNKRTWYAHMFRTQGGDFSFPYEQPQSKVNKAKSLARDIFFGNKWAKQIHPLSWLVEKFWPVTPFWTDEDLANLKAQESFTPKVPTPSKGIIFYTDNQLKISVASLVQKTLSKISSDLSIPIVSCSLKPMNFGQNIHLDLKRGYKTYFTQILTALEASTAEVIFMCEHDVVYHPSHFDFVPTDKETIYYNRNWVKIHPDGQVLKWEADQVSGVCAYRETLINFYRQRLGTYTDDTFDRKFEPVSGHGSEHWHSSFPNLDIRHENNLTFSKRNLDHFRDKRTAKGFTEMTMNDITGHDVTLERIYGKIS